MLATSSSLTELDVQQNDLGNLGVTLLCEGLRQPACQLRNLWLDQTQLSEEVKKMLGLLQQEKPQLVNIGNWEPSETVTEIVPGGGQMSDGTSPPQWQTSEPEESSPEVLPTPCYLLSHEPLRNQPVELLKLDGDFWGPTRSVATEMVDKFRSLYR
ncbi:NACHT, LRR and PYD domains-containing protein 1-like isoform X2 [Pipistrellus kuhlii]|nr:NACHT, LRR and PYD domains-containing protein 1-like isoform X2 [Pipistrellus kuhlii]